MDDGTDGKQNNPLTSGESFSDRSLTLSNSMKLSLIVIFTVLMAGWASAQDPAATNVTDSSSSTGGEVVETGAYAQMRALMTEALSINGAIAAVIIILLVIVAVYFYKRNKRMEEALIRQNRRASAALDSTTTPAAAGSNAMDLHAVVVSAAADDTKDKEEPIVDVPAAPAKVPASPKTVVAGRRGSGSQTRPPAVSTAGKSAGAQPPSPAPQVVKVRRPSLKGNATPTAAAAASPVVSAKSRSRSNTPNRNGTA